MKKILILFLLTLFVVITCSEGGSAPGPALFVPENTNFQVGDIGPAGGVVIFDKYSSNANWPIIFTNLNNSNLEWRWIEAAPAIVFIDVPWGEKTLEETDNAVGSSWQTALDHSTAPAFKTIGSGESNTYAMLSFNSVAHVCTNLNFGGYSNWYIPSRDELKAAYEVYLDYWTPAQAGITYLSSTEIDDYVYVRNFIDGETRIAADAQSVTTNFNLVTMTKNTESNAIWVVRKF